MNKSCVFGIIAGVAFMVLGIVMFVMATNVSYIGSTVTDTSFGGDYYTYQYRATRYAAQNIEGMGEMLENVCSSAFTVGGFGSIAFGIVVVCFFTYKQSYYEEKNNGYGGDGENNSYVTQLQQVAQETTQTYHDNE